MESRAHHFIFTSALEIKINDFDDYANEFNKYHKEIQAELDKAEKDGYIK